MSITGKITNLFADNAMTIPVFPRTKVKAISDDNGVGLDAILADMGGGTYRELVWENASPSSSFSPQTISLALSEGDWIAITYKAATNGTVDYKEFVEVGKNILLIAYANATSSSFTSIYTRRVNTTTTGVQFEKGTSKVVIDDETFGTANDKVIPVRIHVIKGVQR